MIKRRNFIWLVPMVLIVTFPLWRIPIGNFLTPRGGYDPAYGNIDQDTQNFSMKTVRILQSKESRFTAEIRAKSAKTSHTSNEYILDQVDADLFSSHGETTKVIADRGTFNGDTRMLTLMDNVVITKVVANQQLYTDLFYYDDNAQTIHCPGKTRIVGKNIQVDGSSLDYDVEKGQYEVGGRVRTLIQSKSNP